jgi:hypothetical protein
LTLILSIALLVIGSFYYSAPDWDIPISFIMALSAYLGAPWTMRIILERRWSLMPVALLATWFAVDGCYWFYWKIKDPIALEAMRSANFPVSLTLYGICGMVWLYRGSLRELALDIRHAFNQSGIKP